MAVSTWPKVYHVALQHPLTANQARVSMSESTRLIKKYPNRRLYDTKTSAYITLVDVKKLVVEGETVVDLSGGWRERTLVSPWLPDTIVNYYSAGKPIVAVAPEECDVVSLGKLRGFSLCIDPDVPGQFVSRVREIIGDNARVSAMGQAALLAAPDYERSRELRKLVELVEGVARLDLAT